MLAQPTYRTSRGLRELKRVGIGHLATVMVLCRHSTRRRGDAVAKPTPGGADGFQGKNIDYALRLGAAGVENRFHGYPGVSHGPHRPGPVSIRS